MVHPLLVSALLGCVSTPSHPCDPAIASARLGDLPSVDSYTARPIPVSLRVGSASESAAIARFDASFNTTGWGVLWLATRAAESGAAIEDAMFAAGYLEGAATHESVYDAARNVYSAMFGVDPQSAPPRRLRSVVDRVSRWVMANLEWTRRTALAKGYGPALASPGNASQDGFVFIGDADDVDGWPSFGVPQSDDVAYWRTVYCAIRLFDGLVEGYNSAAPQSRQLSAFDLYVLVLDGDLPDVIDLVTRASTARGAPASDDAAGPSPRGGPRRASRDAIRRASLVGARQQSRRMSSGFRCSALIKLIGGLDDLAFGHVTWDEFSTMIRIYKHYDFEYPTAAGGLYRRRVSFSSSPGFLTSVDDFYLTDAGLAVIETTNDNYNDSLTLQWVLKEGAMMSWVRCFAANAIATTGPEWAAAFALYNGGTYNNQWMVLHLPSYSPGGQPGAELLTIVEQMPGLVVAGYRTSVLLREGYWPSYNAPYYPFVFNVTGFPEMVRKYGPDWSYDNCTRANLFRARQSSVVDLDSFKALLRYNDYLHDPISAGDPGAAISSRFDLCTPEQDPEFAGAIDAKATTWEKALKRLEVDIVNGPTHDDVPVFSWVNNTSGAPPILHVGQSDVFDFGFITVAP